jgi:hypothetical protein
LRWRTDAAPDVETRLRPAGFGEASPTSPHRTGAPPAKRQRGAQPGNRLALKHGARAREINALKARVRAIVREANVALAAYRTWKKNGAQ